MNKTAVLQARIAPEKKSTIEQAAKILGLSVSDLLVGSAYEKATAVIKDYQMLELSRTSSIYFAEAIDSHQESGESFKKGAAKYVNAMMPSNE